VDKGDETLTSLATISINVAFERTWC